MNHHSNVLRRLKTIQAKIDRHAKAILALSLEKTDTSVKLGNMLRIHRASKRIRQNTAAKKLEMSQVKLCRIESGSIPLTIPDAEKIAKLMGGRW